MVLNLDPVCLRYCQFIPFQFLSFYHASQCLDHHLAEVENRISESRTGHQFV